MPKSDKAKRFINAYNRLDRAMRDIYNLKPSLSFSDVVRRTATMNYVIKKYEDDLIDYGRLRNAIIHRSTDEVIAEPYDEVVEKMESIVRLVTTPPMVTQILPKRSVSMAKDNVTVGSIIEDMSRTSYSNIPFYLKDTLVGVITRKMLVNSIGECIANGGDIKKYFNEKAIDKLRILDENNHYDVVSEKITIDNVLYMFQQNKKLTTLIITKNGTYKELPVGIIVTSDVIDLQAILDNY